jgi:hypothetical protein
MKLLSEAIHISGSAVSRDTADLKSLVQRLESRQKRTFMACAGIILLVLTLAGLLLFWLRPALLLFGG